MSIYIGAAVPVLSSIFSVSWCGGAHVGVVVVMLINKVSLKLLFSKLIRQTLFVLLPHIHTPERVLNVLVIKASDVSII